MKIRSSKGAPFADLLTFPQETRKKASIAESVRTPYLNKNTETERRRNENHLHQAGSGLDLAGVFTQPYDRSETGSQEQEFPYKERSY
jgi:hypothetical protein